MQPPEKLTIDPRIVIHGELRTDQRARCVVYRMRRAQRSLDNPALNTAIAAANALEQPVVVLLRPASATRNRRDTDCRLTQKMRRI